MQNNIKEILAANPYPKWFKDHKIFEKITTIKKAFPSIGLSNFEKEIDFGGGDSAKKSAEGLLISLSNAYKNRIEGLTNFIAKSTVGDVRKNNGKLITDLLHNIIKILPNSITEEKGKISLKLSEDVSYDDKISFRKGEAVFRVFNKINDLLQKNKFASTGKLEDIPEFKSFSSDNIPSSKFKVVFSSDGPQGAWNIATMSMRGITSCQSWDGDYKYCTIGSVVDPFVGIIYLTSGAKTKYGTKMTRRSVVRFIINEETKKPYILLELMYPSVDTRTLTQFKKLIKARIPKDMEIHYAPNIEDGLLNKSYIPLNSIRKEITNFSNDDCYDEYDNEYSITSYQDHRIKDSVPSAKDRQAFLFDKNSSKKERKFVKLFDEEFSKSFDAANIPEKIKKSIGKNTYILQQFSKNMANDFIKSINKKDFTNSDTYIKRVFYNFFNKKKDIIENNKTKYTKQFGGLIKKKVSNDEFNVVIDSVLPQITASMKEEFKKILGKKTPSEKLPLP